MKHSRKVLIVILLAVCLVLTGCSGKEPTAQDNYESAMALLEQDQVSEAAEAFAALGHYQEAPSYAMYSSALKAAGEGEFLVAKEAFTALGDFLDSPLLAAYYAGRLYEEDEYYESAQAKYESIPLYADASDRAALMPGKAKERDYQYAVSLQENKQYERAISAFLALDGYADSQERIETIRETMRKEQYARADELEKKGNLEEAREVFAGLGDYSDSAERVRAIDYQLYSAMEAADDIIGAYQGFLSMGSYSDCADRAAALKDEATYRMALNQAENGRYSAARSGFTELGDYKDSAERARLLGILDFADDSSRVSSGIVAFRKDGLWGLINLNDHYDLKPAWTSIGNFGSNGLAIAEKNGSYGLINTRGQTVRDYRYSGIKKGSGNLYAAARLTPESMWAIDLLGADGTVLSSWSTLGDSSNLNTLTGPSLTGGVILAKDSAGKWSALNAEGAEVLSGKDGLWLIDRKAENDTLVARQRGLYQFFGTDGKALSEDQWVDAWYFSEGMAMVMDRNYRYGYIRAEDCSVAIEPEFEAADSFSEGYAAVRVNGKWGFINTEGEMVIEPAFTSVNPFSGGVSAVASEDLGEYYIDREGKLIYYKESTYARASELDEAGRYEEAIAAFEALEGYEDSAERAYRPGRRSTSAFTRTRRNWRRPGTWPAPRRSLTGSAITATAATARPPRGKPSTRTPTRRRRRWRTAEGWRKPSRPSKSWVITTERRITRWRSGSPSTTGSIPGRRNWKKPACSKRQLPS